MHEYKENPNRKGRCIVCDRGEDYHRLHDVPSIDTTESKERQPFPHANSLCHGIQEFRIGERWLCLYAVDGRTESTKYSLYWDGSLNVQHLMCDLEVFAVLADYLKRL